MYENSILSRSAVKQAFYVILTLWIYVSIGGNRSYVALLFHQLSLPESKFHLNEDEITWIGTGVGLLSPIGSVVGGFFMDAIGRKKCVGAMFIPFIACWITVSLASGYVGILIGMLFGSVGLGMGMCLITYVSEIASTEQRGLLVAAVDLAYNFGGIMCDILMFYLNWKTVSVIFACCTSMGFLFTFFLPESPLWLYSKGRKPEAIDILCSLRGRGVEQLEDEIKDLEKSHASETEKVCFLGRMMNCLNSWKQFCIATVYFFLVILCGPLLLISYNVVVVDSLKLSLDSALVTVLYSAACFVGSLTTPFLLHKFKRKILLTYSAIGMLFCMLVIAIYEEIFFFSSEKPCTWVVSTAIYIFGLVSNAAVVPVGFIIGGEIFPIEVRGTLQGIFGFLVTAIWAASAKLYPLVMFNLGIRTLIWCFVGFSALLALFCTFILPETKDKTLVEIQEEYFSKKKKVDYKS